MTAQTVWLPPSPPLVLQQPSRKNPVLGSIEQTSSRSPRTFRGELGRPPPFPLSSLSIADSWIAAIPANTRIRRGKDNCVSEGIESAEVVDLAGRTLLPGLIDPHNHTILASLIFELLDDVGYANYPTREKLVAHLKQEAASTPKGQWIVGSNFDNLLQGGDFTLQELDAISTDHPIFVWYTNGHDACVNSEALKVAGIPEDIGDLPGGGHFGRGADGRLNALVYEESAMLKLAVHFLGKITPDVAAKAVTDYARHVGNTMLHEPGTIRSDRIEQFAKLSNTLACRTSASVMFDDMKGLTPFRSQSLGKGAAVENSLFSLYGVKIVGDGSNQTETGAQTKPYLNSASKGSPNFDAARMKQMVAEVKAFGLPVQIHCNGDYTVDIALDAIEAAYSGSTDYGVNRIEHSTMARPDQILRMKTLNVQPSFLMNHVRFYDRAPRCRQVAASHSRLGTTLVSAVGSYLFPRLRGVCAGLHKTTTLPGWGRALRICSHRAAVSPGGFSGRLPDELVRPAGVAPMARGHVLGNGRVLSVTARAQVDGMFKAAVLQRAPSGELQKAG